MRRFLWLVAVLTAALLVIPSISAFQDAKTAQQQEEQKEKTTRKFKGDITEVGKDFIKIARKKTDGKVIERKFTLTDKTKIVFDGKEVDRVVLKKGTSVMVKYVKKDSKLIALKIANKDDEEEPQGPSQP
ncbi:MAG TPA: hypothetical protein VMX35_12140 [Acidobacteriota bacterium]|nr:hypothetical protein [Acidobacteriota bacterium]